MTFPKKYFPPFFGNIQEALDKSSYPIITLEKGLSSGRNRGE